MVNGRSTIPALLADPKNRLGNLTADPGISKQKPNQELPENRRTCSDVQRSKKEGTDQRKTCSNYGVTL